MLSIGTHEKSNVLENKKLAEVLPAVILFIFFLLVKGEILVKKQKRAAPPQHKIENKTGLSQQMGIPVFQGIKLKSTLSK